MPEIIKIYKYEDFVNYTKNLSVLYYKGTVLGIMDEYEEFFVDIRCKSLIEENLNLEKFNAFIHEVEKKFETHEGFKTFYFRAFLYMPNQQITCVRFVIRSLYDVAISPKLYGLIQKIDDLLYKFIAENGFKVLSYKDDAYLINEISRHKTFDPRNPDPNYMFFIKNSQK